MNVTYNPHHQILRRYGNPYAQALQAAGHTVTHTDGDILLVDCDLDDEPWRTACDDHDRVVLYPHGAGLVAYGHGQEQRHRNTVGQFVIGDGHAELAKIAEDIPSVACGWPWTPLHDFRPVDRVQRVLYAPPHYSYGQLLPGEAEHMRIAETRLRRRFPEGAHVKWCISDRPHTLDETAGMIAVADLVATGSPTVLAIAVALGRPAVLFGDYRTLLSTYRRDGTYGQVAPAIADRIIDTYRYPYGIRNIDDALAAEASEWRARFVGGPFDSHACAAAFDTFLGV